MNLHVIGAERDMTFKKKGGKNSLWETVVLLRMSGCLSRLILKANLSNCD